MRLVNAVLGVDRLTNFLFFISLDTTPGLVKLSDFGLSAELQNSIAMCATFVGTFKYMSPERIKNQSYGQPADVWSLGKVVVWGGRCWWAVGVMVLCRCVVGWLVWLVGWFVWLLLLFHCWTLVLFCSLRCSAPPVSNVLPSVLSLVSLCLLRPLRLHRDHFVGMCNGHLPLPRNRNLH